MNDIEKEVVQQEIDSWIPYRRGLRPEDRPAYDKLMKTGYLLLDDEFLSTRVIASDGLFMAGIIARERQIRHLQEHLEMLQMQIKKIEESSKLEKKPDMTKPKTNKERIPCIIKKSSTLKQFIIKKKVE